MSRRPPDETPPTEARGPAPEEGGASGTEGPRPQEQPSPRKVLWEVLGVFGLATLLCALLWQLRGVPLIGSNLHALIAAVFLYLPTFILSRRREEFADYGLTIRPVGRGLWFFFLTAMVVFPLFSVGFYLYYQTVCAAAAQGVAVPRIVRGLCRRFVGHWSRIHLRFSPGFAQLAAAQLLVVALPEEFFFRGYIQTRLEVASPSRRRILGQPVGWSIVWTSVLFALGHVLVDFNLLRLAVFFPSLVFGWLRAATGSILAGVLFHACSNLVSEVLHGFFF